MVPPFFGYKHNGIIIFADWLEIDKSSKTVTIRNPQIVNGAQTITQLFKVYDANRSENNPAKLLVRLYRLPYEDSETYKRSIEIIAALNSQNKIKASDLHSTDPRQVIIESRINEIGTRYNYHRKRTDQGKISSTYNIFMTKLALLYHVCEYKKPDEGISGAIESYFEEDKKYEDSFPENLIKKPITKNVDHIIFKYIDSWRLYYFINRVFKNEISKKHHELYPYVSWYILVDVYNRVQDWKEKTFSRSWHEWMEFIESQEYENGLIKYLKPRYRHYFDLLPKNEFDPRNFYKKAEGRNKFLKNSGNQTLFKSEINKAYSLFKRNNVY